MIKPFRLVVAAGVLAVSAGTALADPIFPKSSSIGLEPPPGMGVAEKFLGFQKGDAASVLLVELPKASYDGFYAQRDKFAASLKGKAEAYTTASGLSGFIMQGEQAAYTQIFRKWVVVLNAPQETAMVTVQIPESDTSFSDAAIAAALKSIVVRGGPDLEPQMAALPFTIEDRQGFVPVLTTGGLIAMLTDKAADAPQDPPAQVIIAASAKAASTRDQRIDYAHTLLASMKVVTMEQIMVQKTYDQGDAQYVELDGAGTEHNGQDQVDLSFYVRFRDNDYIMVLGAAPRSALGHYGDRFKALALSVKPKG